jgi:HSP20 family protein
MSSTSSTGKRDEKRESEERAISPRTSDPFSLFDNFRREMERMMTRPWTLPMEWNDFPSMFEARDTRMALYELIDRGDRYELAVEVPGIEKEKIDVKTTRYSVEISGKHSEKAEEKGKRHIYTERLFRSFYRTIPVPEEIIPSKVTARLDNGILRMELPKKVPTKSENEVTKVEIK